MPLPNISVTLDNGALGALADFAEGVVGLICTGVTVSEGITAGEPVLITSMAEAEALGITVNDNPFAHRQVSGFFRAAGPKRELYLMLVENTMFQSDMVDPEEDSGALKLLNFAPGRIRMLATAFDPGNGYDEGVTSGMDDDVEVAILNAQILALACFSVHQPIRVILSGRDYQGTASTLPDLKQAAQNRVAVVLASDDDDGVPAVGYYVGRLASIPVQRKPSRVKDGPVPITSAYVGITRVEDANLDLLHDKGYIVLRTIVGRSGYYWNGDSTAAPATDDYNTISRGRVIDKAHIIAYGVYVNELDDEVPVTDDGKLEGGFVSYMEAIMTSALNLQMTANGNVSSARVVVDPDQDVIATNKVAVGIRLIPVGYMSEIAITLGFENPNLAAQ